MNINYSKEGEIELDGLLEGFTFKHNGFVYLAPRHNDLHEEIDEQNAPVGCSIYLNLSTNSLEMLKTNTKVVTIEGEFAVL